MARGGGLARRKAVHMNARLVNMVSNVAEVASDLESLTRPIFTRTLLLA